MDTAIPFGLILAELVSNALKHAFPENHPGKISVTTRSVEDKIYELEVSDNGIGFHSIEAQDDSTIGVTLVEDLTRQLNGSLHVSNGQGVTCRILFEDRSRSL